MSNPNEKTTFGQGCAALFVLILGFFGFLIAFVIVWGLWQGMSTPYF